MVKFVLNKIWIATFGWLAALGLSLLGRCCCCAIIGIPAGMACYRLIPAMLFPFGRKRKGREGY